jgi:RimJ/RimL family protein N-acetyltransferase
MAYNRWLAHHGVKGQKWGEKNGPPYPLDSSKSDGHRLLSDGSPQGKKKLKKTKTVFVSGSSKTQDPNSEYYRGELPKDIRLALREHIRKGDKIIVGDAPGIDRQVQDYLKKQKYDNVEIYGPGKEVRYSANPKWKVNLVDDPDHEPGSKEWLAKKDIAMTEAADEGLAIILDDGAKATRNNVRRLLESQKAAKVYSLNKDGTNMWADEKELMSDKVVPKTTITSKSVSKANKIYDSLSDQEKYFLMAEKNAPRYVNPEEYGKNGTNAYSRIEQYKDTPVSVIDIWKNDRGGADVSIAVRNDEKFRHKGYASRALENGLKYFYEHPDIEYLVWGVNAENHPSIELAKKYGFEFYNDLGDGWQTYIIDKEAKHSMAYNRWIYPDELYHHGVLGQRKGVRNGPPYPLDRSLSDGNRLTSKATGSPQGKKRTPTRGGVSKAGKKDQIHSDYGDSLAARAKRKYSEYKAKRAEERARESEEERRARQKDAELYKEQQKRMEDMGLSVNARRGIHEVALDFQDTNDDRQGEALKTAIDLYDKRTKSIKEHGTADEVIKNRERFSKEDMEYISSRLEAEAKIRQFSSKPVEQIPTSKSKGEKLYEKGSAKDVYRNRTELTVEQLETVQRRLNAENKIGEIASKQVNLDSKNMERLKKVRDVLKVLGDSADSIQKIQKIFPNKNNNNNQNNQNNNNNNQSKAGKALEATRNVIGLVNVVREVSDAAQKVQQQNNQQRQGNQQQSNQNNQQQSNQNNQQRQGNQQQSNQNNRQRQGNQQQSNQNNRQQQNNQQQSNQNNRQQQNNQQQSNQNNTRRPGELPEWLRRMRGER